MNTQSRTWRSILTALLLTLALAGCSGSNESFEPGVSRGDAPAAPADGGGRPEAGEDTAGGGDEDVAGDDDRMIIKSKTLRLEVESTADSITRIRDLARSHSGHVTDMQVATDTGEWVYRYDENGYPVGDGGALRGWVTVRVPTEDFEEFVDEVAKIGTVKFQSEASDDVTQEHVDLSARLENLRAQEVRLREFFDAAKNVTEMLSIENELARVRGDIESLDAQVTYLERQAAMATVTVELVEPKAIVRPGGDSWGFTQALTNGVRGAAELVTGAITVLIATAPLWLVALLLFFPIRALVRRRRARRLTPSETPPDPSAAPVGGDTDAT
ncbi:DUF4349 domain-containing protein [Tessaracoccus oleiagri]|uniref:DUF4349 domain-containing protein n=1 Tax=Tessaracoccus oleiagri TaxID=686624 RepID=A0A1G9I4W6_9ACTN|nr:DUF4349 domain-containing protein [Tessaracoccus oleiagri]SDL20269.1 protein of unknown function [Tessaracoccus oleiagri]